MTDTITREFTLERKESSAEGVNAVGYRIHSTGTAFFWTFIERYDGNDSFTATDTGEQFLTELDAITDAISDTDNLGYEADARGLLPKMRRAATIMAKQIEQERSAS